MPIDEALVISLALLWLCLPVALAVLVIMLWKRVSRAADQISSLEACLKRAELNIYELKYSEPAKQPKVQAAPTPAPATPPALLPIALLHPKEPAIAAAAAAPQAAPFTKEPERLAEAAAPAPLTPPSPQGGEGRVRAPPVPEAAAAPSAIKGAAAPHAPRPAKLSGAAAPAPAPARPVQRPEQINWEKFLGVKLFAWVGGLALFLGTAFFLKYSFDNNLISPELRVAMGYLAGIGLMIGGLCLPRERHAVMVQTMCATATVIFYASTFAARGFYHFIGMEVAFALMVLTTASAFLLAVRLNAQVVALLGMLGGFLTPVLLSTGVDNPLGLFGYLALLDIGLLAVVLRKRWGYLCLLAALATASMEFAWVSNFFEVEKVYTGMSVFFGFSLLFALALAVAGRLNQVDRWITAAALVVPAAAHIFTLYLIWYPYEKLAEQPGLLFTFVFLVDLTMLAGAWLRDELRLVHVWAGGAAFFILSAWTVQWLKPELLNTALAFYLLFAVLHAVFPLVLHRLRPVATPLWWVHLYPVLALLLIIFPLCTCATVSLLLWPIVLLIDILAVLVSLITASLFAVLATFVVTALVAAVWIFNLPPALPELGYMLLVIGVFAVFFLIAAVWALRSFIAAGAWVGAGAAAASKAGAPRAGMPVPLTAEQVTQMASLTAVLPFLLLILVVQHLSLADPSPVFGLAALLVVLLLGVVARFGVDLLAPISLAALLLLEHTWHVRSYTTDYVWTSVLWYLGFGAAYFLFPFLFRSIFERRILPWVASALALPLHFFLLYRALSLAFPCYPYMGLAPATLAVPGLLGLLFLARRVAADNPRRNALLALYGGAALFFITLVFPIQFERQWLTVAWALEGLALLWLFHRVPHPGLRLVGCGLLAVSFARLALNPFVVSAYGRTGTPILNWYLYAYGITCACLMLGAKLLAPPRNLILGRASSPSDRQDAGPTEGLNIPPALYALGTVLAFLLLNIEIADYFSQPGSLLTFKFSESLGQDMTYSLAWAAFATVLLVVGFRLNNAPTRYAGVGLMIVTIVKLFLHDLWQLGGLYRIGSLVGLAVVLMAVSFIYQRFLSAGRTAEEAAQNGQAQDRG